MSVGVAVGVGIEVDVLVPVGMLVGVGVLIGVFVGVAVAAGVQVPVGGCGVAVSVHTQDGVQVAVKVGVGVAVSVATTVGVHVAVEVGVDVAVSVVTDMGAHIAMPTASAFWAQPACIGPTAVALANGRAVKTRRAATAKTAIVSIALRSICFMPSSFLATCVPRQTPGSGRTRARPWLALGSRISSGMLLDHGKGGPRCPVNYSYCSTVWPPVKRSS